MENLSPREFLDKRAQGVPMTLVDVREDWETELAPVPSPHLHIPMGQITERLGELDPNATTVVICRSGGRSAEVARFLSGRCSIWPVGYWSGLGTSIPRSRSTSAMHFALVSRLRFLG
jgi:hypothetical protein